MNTKLYVGNLSPLTTAEDLRMLFARAGMVVSVEVVKDRGTGKSKGFGFVEMVSEGDAGKAVSEFNGYSFDNRRLKVTTAKVREPQNGRPMGRNRRPGGYVEYKSYQESISPRFGPDGPRNSR